MAKLTTAERNRLPSSAFVFPHTREYPIPDENHARDALSRVSANGTPAEKDTVRRAVAKRYPGIDVAGAAEGTVITKAPLPDSYNAIHRAMNPGCDMDESRDTGK